MAKLCNFYTQLCNFYTLKMKKHLREYQISGSEKANDILSKYNIVYLAFQVRTGKSATALNTAFLFGAKKVLFLTKKKAISSIEQDYNDFGFKFELKVINNESLHLIKENDFDLVIMDEAHRFGSFPKPSKGCVDFKNRFFKKPIILLSGTPTPESYSQIFHQLWISAYSPFARYANFYKWANDFVSVKVKYVSYGTCNDYSQANKHMIDENIKHLMLTYTQQEAGFESKVNEHILTVDMKPVTYMLCDKLKKDLIIEGASEVILADTGVKLMQKLHQLYSGTVKFESKNSQVIDISKAEFIKHKFAGKKIAIFYKFKAEWDALLQVFGNTLTDNLDIFNSTGNHIALQVIAGREGISLKEADYLVYYNIDFSAVSYWQSRDRLTTMERKTNDVYWVFSKGGIEHNIYKSVMNKKDYTLSTFKKDYGIKIPNSNDKKVRS